MPLRLIYVDAVAFHGILKYQYFLSDSTLNNTEAHLLGAFFSEISRAPYNLDKKELCFCQYKLTE